MIDDYDEDFGALAFIEKRKDFDGKDEDCSEAKKLSYPSFVDRYFKKYYKLDVKFPFNDLLVLLHSNRVCVCTLAPTHPVLNKDKYKIEKIEFSQNVSGNMKGKHKQNAKILHVLQSYCHIRCKNIQNDPPTEERFTIFSCINAKLIEVNDEIVKNPELLQDKSQSDGYLVILYPKLDKIMDQFTSLITHDEFVEACKNRDCAKKNLENNSSSENV